MARVRHFNVTTHAVNGQIFNEIDISNSSQATTGSNNNIIAYRPRFENFHEAKELLPSSST